MADSPAAMKAAHTNPGRSVILAVLFGLSSFSPSSNALSSPLEQTTDGNLLPQNWVQNRGTMPALSFSVDDRLRKNVNFWVRIYTEYTSRQGLVHDAKYIDKVYEVVELGRRGGHTGQLKKKWKSVLLSLHKKTRGGKEAPSDPVALSDEEKRVYQMYLDIQEPNKFLNAAHRKRLRFQLGQRDHFLDGLKQSGRYLPRMEEIFAKEGMPTELTRLPFVESSFNTRARSKVGASGIWQFMRSTAKLFMRVNEAVDERNDPIRATEAAARLLRLNFESLRNWPLAVTAYNHGRKGMMRAVRRVGSEELEQLVTEYRSRSFGFASSNFFTELLAAIEVEKNAERYFGKIDRDSPPPSAEVLIPDYIALTELTTFLKLDHAQIKVLNPGLTDAVYRGERLVPAGYRLRLPIDRSDLSDEKARERRVADFFAGYEQIPGVYKQRVQSTTRGAKLARSGRAKRRLSSAHTEMN